MLDEIHARVLKEQSSWQWSEISHRPGRAGEVWEDVGFRKSKEDKNYRLVSLIFIPKRNITNKQWLYRHLQSNKAQTSGWSYQKITSNWRAFHTGSCRGSLLLTVTFHLLFKNLLLQQRIRVWTSRAKASSGALPGYEFSSFLLNSGRGGLESCRWNWMKIDASCYALWGEIKS